MTTVPYRQLPWVGVDTLTAWTAGDLALVNQVPDAASVGAPRAGPVEFWLMCTVASQQVDQSTIDVWIKPTAGGSFEQVIDNGVFQGSWTGTITSVSAGGVDRIVSITPSSDFGSEAVVSVRVVADVTGSGFAIDETYSFTIEDYEQPQVQSAIGYWPTTVRVTFNEDMGDNALSASGYTVEPWQTGRRAAVTPTVTGVVRLSTTEYELTTDWELTPGAQYRVIAAATVLDEAGNGVDPSANYAVLDAFDYRDDRRLFDGWRIYEQLAEYDRRRDQVGDLERLSEVRQNAVDLELKYADDLRDLTDPDWCDVKYLDHLLYDNGNPLTFVTDEQTKRRIAWSCSELNKRRGTNPGIVLGVTLVTGLECEVVTDRSRRWKLGFRNEDVETAVNESYVRYEAHRILTAGGVHGAEDTVNVVLASLYPASGEAETVTLVNGILTAYQGHRVLTAGGVHGAADTTNAVYRAAATDWLSAAELGGEIIRKYEAHIILTAGGVHGAEDTINSIESRPGDALGDGTLLGGVPATPFSFWLKFDQVLTDAQREDVRKTAEAMRSGPSRYLGTIET